MRLTISKNQHKSLLTELAEKLGSDKPTDALEHILNCWLVGGMLPNSLPAPTPIAAEPVSDDEFSNLLSFN